MERKTKLEIQRTLLSGHEIGWTAASGKWEAVKLGDKGARRLFSYLLQSKVREAKGLSDEFVAGLATAYGNSDDPAQAQRVDPTDTLSGPWRLQKIETEGFGGINTFAGPVFAQELDGDSLILQGPNGSGKSSLVGAILWAMTGERPRDHSDSRPEERANVYDANNQTIGTWPPVACYPTNSAGLTANPHVRVTLTFVDDAGSTAVVERQLREGSVSTTIDPRLSLPDALVETGFLMPSRLPRIRFEKGQTPLTQAVQALTGLDELVDIGALAEGLCHKGREYLSTHLKLLKQQQELFDASLDEARRALKSTGETVPGFQPRDTKDPAGPFAAFGKRLRETATSQTRAIGKDLVAGLDLANAQTQAEVAGAISGAREDLEGGLEALDAWKLLSELTEALSEDIVVALQGATDKAEADIAEALRLDERTQHDNRFRLKALGAQWHQHQRGDDLKDCPLCDEPLKNASLKAEIENLRLAGDAATRQLADNLNAIEARLNAAVPEKLRHRLDRVATLAPRAKLIADIRERFINRARFKNTLATFTTLVGNALAQAPSAELEASDSPVAQSSAAQSVRKRIEAVRRLVSLWQWHQSHAPAWQAWWAGVRGDTPAEASEQTSGDLPDEGGCETFAAHLKRLSAAVAKAEPYRAAADAMGRAWQQGREAHRIQLIQAEREAIAEQLAPLKSLGALADAQARLAIETLSDDIGKILSRLHLTERLTFRDTRLQKKAGLEVRAAFSEGFKIDATLVANTSWLRAVLWAFLFALRQEAVKQLGADPLPLLLLDDPQATFDAEHRHRWAQEILALQTSPTPVQVILATYDEVFVELLKIDAVEGREAIITSAGPELGHVGIFEGAALDRNWLKTKTDNTAAAGQDYIGAVRIYVEGLLRIMLRGHAADVNWAGSGFVMGDAREQIRRLHEAKLAPWDKTDFNALVSSLGKTIPAIKHMEMAHHSGRVNLGMGEAEGVEKHWRDKLSPALRRSFHLAREYQQLHGGLRALHALEPHCEMPEGYGEKLKSFRFDLLGRAAALTDGITADGRIDLNFSDASSGRLVLWNHCAYRLNAPTLEPVARKGDILLVKEIEEPSSRSLVVARYDDRVVARRFEISDNHSDVAVLTAHAVNPRQIAPPIIAKRATLELRKVIGVLFDHVSAPTAGAGEVCDCGGESAIQQYATAIKGLVEVEGSSAEPIALNGQFLLIGEQVSAAEALSSLDGRPVIAGSAADNRYFKRLRAGSGGTVILESLEIGGDFAPVVLTHQAGAETDLTAVWPVYGVLFERP